jgi:hypothetical protein
MTPLPCLMSSVRVAISRLDTAHARPADSCDSVAATGADTAGRPIEAYCLSAMLTNSGRREKRVRGFPLISLLSARKEAPGPCKQVSAMKRRWVRGGRRREGAILF